MELRSAEEELQSLRTIYEALCCSVSQQGSASSTTFDWPTLPPPLVVPVNPSATGTSTANDGTDLNGPVAAAGNGKREATPILSNSSAVEIWDQLETLQRRLRSLETAMQKFQKRLSDQDPVTQKPRYGEKTAERVQMLLENYRNLCQVLGTIFGEPPVVIPAGVVANDEETITCDSAHASSTTIADSIRQLAQSEVQEQQRHWAAEEQRRHEAAEALRVAAERARLEEEQAAAEHARQAQAAAEERTRQAAAARVAVERARQAEAAAERAWLESIPNRKTLDGVREQLTVFAANSPRESIKALHTIFSQISAHPEEDNFRRIRRDHPRFLNDIGQYPGGREVLIAAGFELGFVEEVPSFVCKEPNIEQDMDGWAAWFDLLKGTLELIEQMMMK